MDAPDGQDLARARSVIINFASRIGNAADDEKALAYAADAGWLRADGSITEDGLKLADALMTQSGARSAFRNI
ncbi:MAG: hypothetical protein ACKVS5_08060 [Parvularculaceae bacterium]